MSNDEKTKKELKDGDKFVYDGTTYVLQEDIDCIGCLECDFSDLMLDCRKLQKAGKIPHCSAYHREDDACYVFIEK